MAEFSAVVQLDSRPVSGATLHLAMVLASVPTLAALEM